MYVCMYVCMYVRTYLYFLLDRFKPHAYISYLYLYIAMCIFCMQHIHTYVRIRIGTCVLFVYVLNLGILYPQTYLVEVAVAVYQVMIIFFQVCTYVHVYTCVEIHAIV